CFAVAVHALRGGASGHAHFVDAPPLHVEHLDAQPVDLEALADLRHAPDAREQVAAERLEALTLDPDAEPRSDLVDVRLPAHDVAPVALVHDRLGLDVVFIANLADDLLEQILDRD